MPAFRFVHAADIHLDSPLRSLSLRNADLADLIGGATRRALERIVDLCVEEKVDALMLAGDLYDGDQTSMKTARFLADQMRRLEAAGIRVFVVRGNHDALSRITRELVLPDTVKLFDGRADTAEIERARGDKPIFVHGLSFAKPQAPESLLPKYKPPTTGAINIGLMHTSLDGAAGHDIYAPCSTSDLANSGFRYWGLGHIHKRSATVHGQCTIVMPGIPQGRDAGEDGAKSVTLVTVTDDGSITTEERTVSTAQFERISVDVSGVADWKDLISKTENVLGAAGDAVDSKHVVARLSITGLTPFAWMIRRDADLFQTELESRVAAIGNVWIDKIEIECGRPAAAGGAVSADPVEELRQAVQDDVVPSEEFRSEITAMVDDFLMQLPPEIRRSIAPDEAALASLVKRLKSTGPEEVLAKIASASHTEQS